MNHVDTSPQKSQPSDSHRENSSIAFEQVLSESVPVEAAVCAIFENESLDRSPLLRALPTHLRMIIACEVLLNEDSAATERGLQ